MATFNLVIVDTPTQLVVQSTSNVVEVTSTASDNIDVIQTAPDAVIEVVAVGPQGPQGIQGPPGEYVPSIADLPAGTTMTAVFNTSWPSRPTNRPDIVVLWIGGTEAPTNALTNDMWIRNP